MERERKYEGPAVLVLDDAETEVTADLTAYRAENEQKWCGVLHSDRALEDFAHFAGRRTLIRLTDSGREGQVLLHGWGSQYVRVEGEGEAPF